MHIENASFLKAMSHISSKYYRQKELESTLGLYLAIMLFLIVNSLSLLFEIPDKKKKKRVSAIS